MKAHFLALLFVNLAMAAWGQGTTATVKAEAQKCAEAVLKANYEGMVLYTHPKVVTLMGGREKMIQTVKNGMAQMHEQGAEFTNATIGQPEELKKFGTVLTSMVPQHIVIKIAGGKLQADSMLLGISEDEGKHWTFMDLGAVTKEQFAQVFPELDGKITLPEKKKPVFSKDE